MSWLSVEIALLKSISSKVLDVPLVLDDGSVDIKKVISDGPHNLDIIQENESKERLKDVDFWMEVENLPAPTEPLDKNLTDQYNGIFQVTIYGKRNKGKAGVLTQLDKLTNIYKTGNQFIENNCIVEIDSISPEPALPEGSFFILPVSIVWFAFIRR